MNLCYKLEREHNVNEGIKEHDYEDDVDRVVLMTSGGAFRHGIA